MKLVNITTIYIFGEDHSKKERDEIEKKILNIKPKALLTEEAGNFEYFSKEDIKQAIKNKQYGISSRSYKLGLKLGIPVIGIDRWDIDYANLSLAKQFELRESRMLSQIIKYAKLYTPLCVIVGDAHIRTQGSQDLIIPSASPIYMYYKNNIQVTRVRSKNKELI